MLCQHYIRVLTGYHSYVRIWNTIPISSLINLWEFCMKPCLGAYNVSWLGKCPWFRGVLSVDCETYCDCFIQITALLINTRILSPRDVPPNPPRGSVLNPVWNPVRVISCLSLPTAWGQCNKHALCVNALYLWYYVLVTIDTDFPLLLSQAEHFLWWLLLCQSGDTGEWGGPPGDSFQTAGHCTQAHALTWGGCGDVGVGVWVWVWGIGGACLKMLHCVMHELPYSW